MKEAMSRSSVGSTASIMSRKPIIEKDQCTPTGPTYFIMLVRSRKGAISNKRHQPHKAVGKKRIAAKLRMPPVASHRNRSEAAWNLFSVVLSSSALIFALAEGAPAPKRAAIVVKERRRSRLKPSLPVVDSLVAAGAGIVAACARAGDESRVSRKGLLLRGQTMVRNSWRRAGPKLCIIRERRPRRTRKTFIFCLALY